MYAPLSQRAEKWNQQPDQTREAEHHDSQNLAVDGPDLGRDQFQRLEHEQEIPFRLDAGGRRSKWIRFRAQSPRGQCGQRAQHDSGDVDQCASQGLISSLRQGVVLTACQYILVQFKHKAKR